MKMGGMNEDGQFLGGDRLLLIPEAAECLRVSHKTVRRMIVAGTLPSHKLRGKRLVRLSALNALFGTGGGKPCTS